MIWLNGRLQHPAQARIDPADRGLLLGDGVFETVRALARRPLHLPRHLARMRRGAAVLELALPWTDEAVGAGIAAVLDAGQHDDAVVRLTLTRGPAPRGLLPASQARPTLLVAASTLPAALPPACAIVARCTRRNEHSPLSGIKSLNYLDSILARQEAARAGADEAILLNTAGFVAEASAGNLFVRLGDAWLTPPVADGALPGIARALILEAGVATERRITSEDLSRAHAAVVSSSLGLRALASIDGAVLPGHGEPWRSAEEVG